MSARHGLAADVLVVIRFAADDAAQRDEARVALHVGPRFHGADGEADQGRHLEHSGHGESRVGNAGLVQDLRGARGQGVGDLVVEGALRR